MNEAFRKFLKTTFDIREGEVLRAVLMQLNIFLVISTLLVVKPTVNGLFLSKIGVENLPIAFILVAAFAALLSNLYARYLGRVGLNRILIFTLSASVLLFVMFGVLLRINLVEGWVLYAFYVWVAIFGVLTASQFWILANMVFNVREAKRLFGFIGSGAIAGGIFGGYLTNVLAGWLGSENLLFVGAWLLFFCIPITSYIWNNHVRSTQSKFQRRKRISKTKHPVRLILQSKHLTYLAGIVGISVIVAKLVDYQFSAIASSIITDPDELTAFFGLWFSNFNVISLIVQILLTRRVLGTLGVGSSLFFLPSGILLGAMLIFFFPELWAAIIIKMSDGSLKQSINKAAVELLALPIPAEIKSQTKTFIDVLVDSVATGIGGAILIFLVKGLSMSPQFISLMIAGLILIWTFFILEVQKEYLKSFKQRVEKARGGLPGKEVKHKRASILNHWRKVLESGSEKQILFILRKIKEQPDSRFFEHVAKLLYYPSDRVRAQALKNLYFFKNQQMVEQIRPLIHDPYQKVKIAALEYLIAHSPEEVMISMKDYLNDPDLTIRVAALVSLAKESRDNPKLKSSFELADRIMNHLRQLPTITDPESRKFIKIGIVKSLGYAKMPELFHHIDAFFKDDDPAVVNQAIRAAGFTMHPYFIPTLVGYLEHGIYRKNARMALRKYGREIVKILFNYAQDPATSKAIVRVIPSIMQRFGSQETTDYLFELLIHNDAKVRLAALRALNSLKTNYAHLKFNRQQVLKHILEEARLYQDTLSVLYSQIRGPQHILETEKSAGIRKARKRLIVELEKKLDSNLERIFRLLGLKYSPEDVITIFEGIQSPQPDLRMNAIEYLDNLLEPGLKKVLIPIVETALLDTISEDAIQNLNLKIPTEQECFEMLMTGQDIRIKLAVLNLIAVLDKKQYLGLLKRSMQSSDEKIKRRARMALEALEN